MGIWFYLGYALRNQMQKELDKAEYLDPKTKVADFVMDNVGKIMVYDFGFCFYFFFFFFSFFFTFYFM